MGLIIILGIIIVGIIINEAIDSKPKKERKLVAYDIHNGQPIYLDQCRFLGFNTVNGNPMFENPYHIIKYDRLTGAPIYATFELDKAEYDESKIVGVVKKVEVKKPTTEEDRNRISNSILMIVGALLIVIASIIFLASSWETTSGIIKTLVLVLIQVMFIIFGYICNKKLNIIKVAKVFNYLALCFVPIILLSLSTFELIGDYLSIGGEGFLLYLALVFLVSDFFYKGVGITLKDKVSKIMSYVAEVAAITFISSFLDISTLLFLIILSIYNILVYVLVNTKFIDYNAYKIPNNILSYFTLFLLVLAMINTDSLLYYLPMGLYTIYYYIMYVYGKENNSKVYNFVFFIITYIIDLTIINKIEISPYFGYILGIIPLVLLTKVMKNEKSKNVLYIVEGVFALLFVLEALAFPNKTIYYLMTFIVGFIFYILMYAFTKKPIFKIAIYVLFTAIFIDIFYITDMLDYAKYIPLVVILLVYSLELVFDNLKDQLSSLFISLVLMIEAILLRETYFVLVPLIFTLVYIKQEKLSEGLLVIPMMTSLTLFGMNDNVITLGLSYLLISLYTVMSLMHKNFNIYSFMSFLAICTAAQVFNYSNILVFAIVLLWTIVHIIRNIKDDNLMFKFINIISVVGLCLSILSYYEVDLQSLYLIGYYVAVMAISLVVFTKIGGNFDKFFGCFAFAVVSIISFYIIKDVTDALIIMSFLFLVSLVSFVMKWHHYLYEALIIMVINIIYLTAEFWAQIPWYFYILVIGMILIIFAMFDEKLKQKKALKVANNVVPFAPVLEPQVVTNELPVENKESEEVEVKEEVLEEVPVEPKEEVSEVKEEVLEEKKEPEIELPKETKEEVKTPKKRGRKKKTETK